MRTNQASYRSMRHQFRILKNPCSEVSISRSKPKRGKGGRFSPHTSHVIGGREDQDSQHGQARAGFHTLQWTIHTTVRSYEICMNFNIIIL
jgi:hypothetical protein